MSHIAILYPDFPEAARVPRSTRPAPFVILQHPSTPAWGQGTPPGADPRRHALRLAFDELADRLEQLAGPVVTLMISDPCATVSTHHLYLNGRRATIIDQLREIEVSAFSIPALAATSGRPVLTLVS